MKKEPKQVGRPKKEIDWDLVKKLANIQCTQREIAGILEIPLSTLTGREEFSDLYKNALENGKASIRRAQFALMQKSAAMAIWLGKQYLDQHDEPKQAEVTESKVIQVVFK